MKELLTTVLGLFPNCRLKIALLNRAGHRIDSTARVGPIVIVGRTKMIVASGAIVGPFNVVRNVGEFRIGEKAEIGQWNWFSSFPTLVENSTLPDAGCFQLGAHSSVTSRHFFDVSGGISIGKFTTIAGARSVFMTHGIDVVSNLLLADSIQVGDYAMVGSSSNLVMGSSVPNYSVVAMGSTIIAGLEQERSLYAGTPAVRKKGIAHAKYWSRPTGRVLPPGCNAE